MKSITIDNYEFSFNEVINAFRFDETDRSRSTFHGMTHCMKAVDLIIESPENYYFVEVKNLRASEYDYSEVSSYSKLVEVLKYKFRDSFLYRYAEEKLDKAIHYICLLELDKPLQVRLKRELKQQLPINIKTDRWHRPLLKSVQVIDSENWNRHFKDWPVKKV